ncbi:MAG: hypothetical protein AAGA54_15115 [Myxococcota bacterium]
MHAYDWTQQETDDPAVSLPSRPALIVIDGGGAAESGTYAVVRARSRMFRQQLRQLLPLLGTSFLLGFIAASATLWIHLHG